MNRQEHFFRNRYALLNDCQRRAVDTIYGPVMVIAGPGTGKTEVLAMRIAALLHSDAQVQPYDILCLTFTDEATIAMRRRLLQIIGEEAHKVPVYTFHAFCNHIIQTNPEYFGLRDMMPVSDLERMDILYLLIEKLPEGHLLRRLKGNLYYDARHLGNLFGLMKSEAWSPELVSDAIDVYLESLPDNPAYQYKRANAKKGIQVGDQRTAEIRKEQEKMERTRAAALLFPVYQHRMAEAGRYDFYDMILWVLQALRERPDFLQRQQERFQFILVDEFQDTSGAQSELLSLLADYWDDPNLFIVGDDDQSVFEFQGARMQNIIDFYRKYEKSISVVVLKDNYRSSQPVLDQSMTLIGHNEQRLIRHLETLQLDKNLMAASLRFKSEDTPEPVVTACYNTMHEEAGVVEAIERLQQQGVPLSTVAVLYARHKQAAKIIALLEKKNIPYAVKRPVNILDLPLVTQLLHILRYLQMESTRSFSGEELLFQLLHTPFFGIESVDVAMLSMYLQQKEKKHQRWRFLLQDTLLLETLGLKHPQPIRQLSEHLEKWIGSMHALTLPMLLEDILYDGGIAAHILKGDAHIWEMQVLHTFFSFVQEEADKNPRMPIHALLDMTDKMIQEAITIPIQKVVSREDGVCFYTAFGAKGHEFEHVFLIGANKQYWETKAGGNRGFALPDTLTRENSGEGQQEEVARRLFYVAMTRAKKHLYISYAEKDNNGKLLEPSRYVDEISKPETRSHYQMDTAMLTDTVLQSLLPDPPVQVVLARKDLIDKRLEQFVLSVSAMNRYLRCPIAFYYEYILRAPEAKSDALGFGIAVHYALEQLYPKPRPGKIPEPHSEEKILSAFRYVMRREESSFTAIQYERRMELGMTILKEYYQANLAELPAAAIAEYNIPAVTINGVPARGKLDRIDFAGNNCRVIDYKTGSPDYALRKELSPPDDNNPNGGDYWRQMVFYKLLLDNYLPARSWRMTDGVFDFIEKNKEGKFVRYTVPIMDNDTTFVRQQIREVYERIMRHEFDTGCGQDDCRWCKFVTTNKLSL